jgi:ABC-2 type transport system permease protein
MNAFSGTRALLGLAVRRDRYRLVAYVLGLTGFLAATAAMFAASPQATLTDGARTFASNAAVRMMGLASGDSVGAYTLLRDYLLLAVLAGLISALMVVRHTRQNEETGRAELVGAGVVGRYASLTAALIVTIAANVALAILLALSLIINGLPVTGSLMAGVSISIVGVTFAGVAAVAAQLSSTTRGASGLAAAVLGIAFLLSGLGNMLGSPDASGLRATTTWPAWLSPLGWGEQMRPFAGDHWVPLMVAAIVFVALVGTAGALINRRDSGAGILADRRGNAEAPPGLLSPLGLVWRLQRGALLGWAIGMAGFGLVFGAMIKNVQDSGGATARWYMRAGGSHQILDAYRTSIIEMAGMAIAVYIVQMLVRMRSEEANGPLEQILATAVSRPRWMASHLINAILGALVLLMLFATSMGLAVGAALGDTPRQIGTLLEAAAVQLPGILAIAGIVVALTALAPRWAAMASWIAVAASIVAGPIFGGSTLNLPHWLQDISPFTILPKVPGAPFEALPVAGVTIAAATLLVAGVMAFRRRNLALPV